LRFPTKPLLKEKRLFFYSSQNLHKRLYTTRIAGTGIEVWEVIATYKSVDEEFERLRTAYHWLNELQLRAALGYYRAYPKEIDALIGQNRRWTKESIHRTYPFLAGTSETFT
jgi:uncharacterized protein (DUF433 family)